jgi:hypothetical protein
MTTSRRDILRLLATMPAAITLVACGTSSTDESESSDPEDSTSAATTPVASGRVPEPLAIIRTSWSTDPWARGLYGALGRRKAIKIN